MERSAGTAETAVTGLVSMVILHDTVESEQSTKHPSVDLQVLMQVAAPLQLTVGCRSNVNPAPGEVVRVFVQEVAD